MMELRRQLPNYSIFNIPVMSISITDFETTELYVRLAKNNLDLNEIYAIANLLSDEEPDKWFTPPPGTPLFNACGRLWNMDLICRMEIPVWKDGKLKKKKKRYLYNLSLNF